MPINTQHEQYQEYATRWSRARDASAGQYAVHRGGETYLPSLADQDADDYKAYKLRASYFNATGRTIDGLVGMVFRKPPVIEQNGLDDLIDDIDLSGNSLASFAQTILREVITVYRFGVLVEYPMTNGIGKTMADKQRMNERPYATMYKTESIVNWEEARVNNKMQPVLIVLQESYETDGKDEYEKKTGIQYRELKLEMGATSYIYVQRIWREVGTAGNFEQFGDDIIPLLNNAPLSSIPFFPFGSDENSLKVQDSVILPLADLNLAHYRVTADYEHGCHFTGLPMLFLKGIQLDEGTKVMLGSQAAVTTSNPDADGKYIEFTGQGLASLENNLERKEKQLAVLGARFLENQKNGVEAEQTMRTRSSGENSILAGIAELISDQLSNMLAFMSVWYGVQQDVTVHLNTDFMPIKMTPQELTALVGSWQSGAISKRTLFMNLQEGEVISTDVNFEDEEEEISNATPNLLTESVA
jgi:hypothetical protein